MKKKSVLYTVLFIFVFLGLWAFWFEPSSLSTKEWEITVPHWPRECDGLKIAIVADLHVGSPFMGIERLPLIVEMANKLNPHLILMPGDYVIDDVLGGKYVEPEPIAHELRLLKANAGVYAVLGNHDWWNDPERIGKALVNEGITLLEDKNTQVQWEGCSFWIAGITDYDEGPHDVKKALSGIPDKAPTIVLTHNPDVYDDIPSSVSIIFAGNTHGGQVFLPILGRPIVPSRFGERFAIGHINENGKHMFVSVGIGTSILPVRFRVPPEISVVTLRSQEK